MAAGSLDFSIEQGATFRRQLTIKDSDDNPVDLTGRTFRGKIKDKIQGTEAVAFTFALANQITDPGILVMSLTATQTAAISVPKGSDASRTSKQYIYDVEMVYGSGDVDRVLQGKVTVSAEVTT